MQARPHPTLPRIEISTRPRTLACTNPGTNARSRVPCAVPCAVPSAVLEHPQAQTREGARPRPPLPSPRRPARQQQTPARLLTALYNARRPLTAHGNTDSATFFGQHVPVSEASPGPHRDVPPGPPPATYCAGAPLPSPPLSEQRAGRAPQIRGHHSCTPPQCAGAPQYCSSSAVGVATQNSAGRPVAGRARPQCSTRSPAPHPHTPAGRAQREN